MVIGKPYRNYPNLDGCVKNKKLQLAYSKAAGANLQNGYENRL